MIHGQLFDINGARIGLGGVHISISWLREGELPITLGGVTTNKKGNVSWYSGGGQEKSGVWQFTYSRTGYESITTEDYYQGDKEHHIEQKLYQEDFVDERADKEALNAAWNLQSEAEKLAMSFISALAIIMVFKVLQGFSMERVNPVA